MRTPIRLIRCILIGATVLVLLPTATVQAATSFAVPAFETAYRAGEAITPNFWGPLATATEGATQRFNGRDRTVQYFEKGRMEQTEGSVTFGLLATEMVTGRLQEGDTIFRAVPPARVAIAGDEDGGPTYADIAVNRALLLSPVPNRVGNDIALTYRAGAFAAEPPPSGPTRLSLTDYDNATSHHTVRVFRDYRDRVGLGTLGYALSEPFAARLLVGGYDRAVVVQVFERRVLTFTPENPPAFQVEMGNIGRHYFRWQRANTPGM